MNADTKKRQPTDAQAEYRLHVGCVKWFWLVAAPKLHRPWLWHTPNGGQRDVRVAAKLKAMGTLKGAPDLMALWMAPLDGNGGGLLHRQAWIELKAGKGRVSPEQEEWHRMACHHDVSHHVVRTLDEFAAVFGLTVEGELP